MKSVFLLAGLFVAFWAQVSAQTLQSPDKNLVMTFSLSGSGVPTYALIYKNKPVVLPSALGLEIESGEHFTDGFEQVSETRRSVDSLWTPVWGEVAQIREQFNELVITLKQAKFAERKMELHFRLFNDGLGFRYSFPEQNNLRYFVVTAELSSMAMAGDHTTWWLPGDMDSQEYHYTETPISAIDAAKGRNFNDILVKSFFGAEYVQTPLMMKSADGLYINIHEAALFGYPAMHLKTDRSKFVFTSQLVPDVLGKMAYLQAPFSTPWRTILVSDKATDILASKTILNLNPPSKIADPSWIKPQKFVGIWWEMHIQTGSWNYADINNVKLDGTTDFANLKPNGRHSANTTNAKRYIDFAAKNNIDGVLIEGWNVGWEDWIGNWKENVFDFVTPYKDFDVEELSKYAASKGVKIIMHHETSSAVTNYERRLHDAFNFMKKYGYDAVKTGYVGKIIPRGERHDGQWMINHYTWVAQEAAKKQIMIDAHESVRLTGGHRTWPNWMASEAARGNEFNAWSEGNPPGHETILPFTRLMGGPMDYTPGVLMTDLRYGRQQDFRIHTTLTAQLALYVTMYSPVQMAADLPENYEKFSDAFQFIRDVAVDWDDSKYISAEPYEFITVVRKAKGKADWFLGSITDEKPRTEVVKLDFLDAGKAYVAECYFDAKDAHWQSAAMKYTVSKHLVNSKTAMKLNLAAGGGAAVRFRFATPEEVKTVIKWK